MMAGVRLIKITQSYERIVTFFFPQGDRFYS